MRSLLLALIAGFLFSLGLALSGMTQPQKIIGFLNFNDWDPSLLFVMLGAVGVHSLSYRFIRRRSHPLFDTQWHVGDRKDITCRLVLGSALFGIGWGLGGYCPGPALVSLSTFQHSVFLFVGMMITGMLVFRRIEHHKWIGK